MGCPSASPDVRVGPGDERVMRALGRCPKFGSSVCEPVMCECIIVADQMRNGEPKCLPSLKSCRKEHGPPIFDYTSYALRGSNTGSA